VNFATIVLLKRSGSEDESVVAHTPTSSSFWSTTTGGDSVVMEVDVELIGSISGSSGSNGT